MNEKMRILLADDDTEFCARMSAVLDSADDFELVGIAENGEKALSAVNELRPDVLIIELMLPRHNDGRFPHLQWHDKTCWATVGNHNTGIGHILYHLLIWNQFAPLAVFRLICTKAGLDNHIIFDNAIAF